MKILATGDWHIGLSQYSRKTDSAIDSRLADTVAVLDEIVEIAVQQSVDCFICSGDIFHTNHPTPRQQEIFLDLLLKLESQRIRSAFIIGNHDFNAKPSSGHALLPFKKIADRMLKFVSIYDKTTEEVFTANDGSSLRLIYYPYRGDEPDFSRCGEDGIKTALVCHSHLEGAVVGAEPFEIAGDSATKFKHLPVDYIFAGHFHKPQILSEKPLAFYPGSIQCVDFNERYDEKGVNIIDTELDQLSCMTRHPLNSRKFKLIELVNRVELNAGDLSGIKDSVVKIIVRIHENDLSKFSEEKILKTIKQLGAHTITGISYEIVRPKAVRNSTVRLSNSVIDNFSTYTSLYDSGDLRTDVDVKGREIISKCE